MSLNLFFSESQSQLIQKFDLEKEIESLVKDYKNEVIDLIELKNKTLEKIEAKIVELQDKLADKLKKTEILNPFKMTSIDSWSLQKILKEMKENSCESVILELSSQGLEQNRHVGLGQLFIAGFLNIFPEHIESHGSFENYINAKAILFSLVKPKGFVIANQSNQLSEVLKFNKSQTEPIVISKAKDYNISPLSSTMYKEFEFGGIKENSFLMVILRLKMLFLVPKLFQNILNKKAYIHSILR